MAKAIIEPAEVRRFANELRRFNIELQNQTTSLQGRFTALGESWQDQEQTKFADEFVQTMKVLKKFLETSNRHVPYLMKKAERIEEYLNQR